MEEWKPIVGALTIFIVAAFALYNVMLDPDYRKLKSRKSPKTK